MDATLKLPIRDIGAEGLDLTFKKDQDEVHAMMEVTKGDFRGTDEGMQVYLHAQRVYGQESTILIRGQVTAGLAFSCVRCLEDREHVLSAPIDAVLLPLQEAEKSGDDVELSAEDMDVSFYEDEEIDRTDIGRGALLLGMPSYPTCDVQEECKPHLIESEEVEPGIDPRWKALLDIKTRMSDEKN